MTPRSVYVISITVALVAMGAAPAFAGGSWYGGEGDLEPSTSYDTDAFMQQHPNDAAHPDGVAERIYFNGFILTDYRGTNLEGGSVVTVLTDLVAMLGYWRDCNGDGYIGAKNAPTPYGNWNSGAYPSEGQSIDTTLCASGTPYNQGTFVDEFRWIGPHAAATDSEVANQKDCNPADWTTLVAWCAKQWRDPHDVTDNDAKVWGDLSRPDSQAASTSSVNPGYAHQNSSGTLEFVNFFVGVDDFDGFNVSRDVDGDGEADVEQVVIPEGTWESKPNLGHCDGGDARSEFMGGDEFLGVTGTCGLYPLWQTNRLENDSRSHDEPAEPLVTVYDTETDDDGSESACDDTTLPTGHQMADPDPDVHDNPLMRGSVGGTRQNVEEGTGNRAFDGECGAPDPNSSGGSEGPIEGKVQADAALEFKPDKRFQTARALGIEYVPGDGLGAFGGPVSGGLPVFGPADWVLFATSAGPKWFGNTSYTTIGVPGALGPSFATFFADVGEDAFVNAGFGGASPSTALPAGVQDAHTYGSLQCGGDFSDSPENEEPNAFGWVCSKAVWDRAEANDDAFSASARNKLGHTFDFRDVDCHDDSVADVEVAGERYGQWEDVDSPSTGDTIRDSCADWRSTA